MSAATERRSTTLGPPRRGCQTSSQHFLSMRIVLESRIDLAAESLAQRKIRGGQSAAEAVGFK
jgi:hypothetical protein